MIAVWFSNGAASACALKLTIEKYGIDNIRAVNNPVKEEHPDNLRFQIDVANWCGIKIHHAIHKDFPECSAVEVWEKKKAMSFIKGAPCTFILKKQARQQWEAINKPDYHVLGFTYDEKRRHERFVLTERENVLPVLIDAKMTKNDCYDMIRGCGLKLPAMYDLGFPNANCIGCVKATSATYWNLVRSTYPNVFTDRSIQSRALNVKLARHGGMRIFLDELPQNAKGAKLRSMPECGLFCEEP